MMWKADRQVTINSSDWFCGGGYVFAFLVCKYNTV